MIEGLAQRLKQARKELGYTQREMAEAMGTKLRSLQDYERGRSVPGGRVIASCCRLGINPVWLLNGHGGMWLRDPQHCAMPNTALLEKLLAGLEEALCQATQSLDPVKKAQVITFLYQWFSESGMEPDPALIRKVLRLAE